ncbi:hypothetical protein PAMA_018524 [Pampus argenteus]
MLGFGAEYGRVSFDVLRLKRYMTSAPGMIGMEERGSDGSYSSSSSSFSAEGPESFEGQGVEPRLGNTRPLFVIVVWNFELYMIPLALLLPLAWNYILIASGKDTRQDVLLFSPPPPASSTGSTPASPLSKPLLGESWLGHCRWKGPPLRATALTACERPAWVSQAQPEALIRHTALPQSAETVV